MAKDTFVRNKPHVNVAQTLQLRGTTLSPIVLERFLQGDVIFDAADRQALARLMVGLIDSPGHAPASGPDRELFYKITLTNARLTAVSPLNAPSAVGIQQFLRSEMISDPEDRRRLGLAFMELLNLA